MTNSHDQLHKIVTQTEKDRTVTGTVTAVSAVSANFKDTEVNSGAIKTAVEKIDNQEDSITYVCVPKATTDGDIIAAPGEGYRLKIHHIYVNNAGANTTIFHIRDDTNNKFSFCLAAEGGAVAQNLKRPWDLTENKALTYDYISGAAAVIFITIGYVTVAV